MKISQVPYLKLKMRCCRRAVSLGVVRKLREELVRSFWYPKRVFFGEWRCCLLRGSFPGLSPGDHGHSLGVRSESLIGQNRAVDDDPVAGEERPVRHGAIGHPEAVLHDSAGHVVPTAVVGRQAPPPPSPPSPPPPPPQQQQPQRVRRRRGEAPVVREAAASAAAGRRRGRLRQHHPLAPHAHLPPPLRRLHRVPGQGPRHVRAGPRRPRAVRAASREHEGGLQGQEETYVSGERAVRVTPQAVSGFPPRSQLNLHYFFINIYFVAEVCS